MLGGMYAPTRRPSLFRRFCGPALVAVATTSLMAAGATPAEAAIRLTRGTCSALYDGSYSVDDGLRQCTVVTTYNESQGVASKDAPDESDPALTYRGVFEYWITIRYTQTYSQRYTEEWSMTGGDEILDEWYEPLGCYLVRTDDGQEVLEPIDLSECESRGLLSYP
jgi:hypothetical protein